MINRSDSIVITIQDSIDYSISYTEEHVGIYFRLLHFHALVVLLSVYIYDGP